MTLPRPRLSFVALLSFAALVFVLNLDVSHYANVYYSAAAQAGASSWKAMFFGSLDPANAITVDKPPLGLWPMALSVRLLGLSSWSVLLPQALEGVACVALVHACVRRATGADAPALLAGVVFALTPVAALVFRYNNPDAMLTLVLLGAAWATLRSLDGHRATAWLALAGVLGGLGFLTKMLEAFVVVPALALTHLAHGRGDVRGRLTRLLAAGAALAATAGSWIVLVDTWPATDRPFVGGSPGNSVLQLALGYNGLDRINGSSPTSNGFAATNLARISRTDVGGEVMWLVPAALLLGVLAWWLSRRHDRGARIRASLLLWGSWFVLGAATFAGMAGIFHSYYTVILTPAVAAVVGTGAWLAWEHRDDRVVRWFLVATVLVTAITASGTFAVVGFDLAWTALPVLVLGVVAAWLLRPRTGRRPGALLAALALVSALAGPATFTAATVALPHAGSGPMAGPGRASTDAVVAPEVVAMLGADAGRHEWAAAAMGARSAAAYEVATGAPVMAIGGYKGTDPLPTLAQFQAYVRAGRIHYLLSDGTYGDAGRAVQAWVAPRFAPTLAGGHTVYDLTRPVSAAGLSSGSAVSDVAAR